MSENRTPECPECEAPEAVGRRDFLRAVGGTAVGAVALGALPATPRLVADESKPRAEKPAEALIKELFAGLSAEQKKQVVHTWDRPHRNIKNFPARLGMYNAAIGSRIDKVYNKGQVELVERILKAMSSGDEGWKQITRNGTWDGSGAMTNCGADIFGNPDEGKYAFVFTGHHLTLRCDGNSLEGAAFGGPIYYGHTPNPYSDRNCFYYQTKKALEVYNVLSEKQRELAVVKGTPGEHEPSIKLRPGEQKWPGIAYADLSKDQQALVENVMRTLLSPYRKEDADETMEVIKSTGGMDKVHLAFYPDAKMKDDEKWHFWRVEGPGIVWNFRVLPHVHTYVSISSKVI